ncbi:MAG: hypothetical protein AAFO77_05015 [Pseudomonadota bacterium]
MATAERNPHRMVHPGPVHPKRIEWARGDLVHAQMTDAPAGTTLRDAVTALVSTTGQTSGTGRFQGSFSKFRFTTGGPARDGKAANYTYIRDVDGPSELVDVRFTFGLDADDACFVHAHGTFNQPLENGEQGGHLFPDACMIATSGHLSIVALEGLLLRQQVDAETLHNVFDIERGADAGRGMFVRVRPNEDLTIGLERTLEATGAMRALSINSIGSINAPIFCTGSSNGRKLDNLGMELLTMDAAFQNGRCTIACDAIDRRGHTHSGTLKPGHAPVCVTAEIMLEVLC